MISAAGLRPLAFLVVFSILTACSPQYPAVTAESTATATATVVLPSPTIPPPTPTLLPTNTPQPTLFPLPTAEAPMVACDKRSPAEDDLYPLVTASFGLSPDYFPRDLVKLGGYLSYKVVNPGFLFRKVAVPSLVALVQAMQSSGLHPLVLSTYRGYYDQVIVRQEWEQQDPNNADLLSAVPGHSEHQLGTVVDFGSLELPGLVGDPAAKFDPLFAQTSEGRWLAEHAFEYGFTMTNPPDAQPLTGLIYEPWHYRYVGIGLATYLHTTGSFLAYFLFQSDPGLPCMPTLNAP
jgi:zinc D-Ala-D-Ala carboxypeptidase